MASWRYFAFGFYVGRIKLAAACLEAQRRTVTGAVHYANERVQFKTPISSFGAIQAKIAEMATNAYAGESATYRAAADIENRINIRVSEGNSHQEAELKGVEEFAIECSILKVAVSEDVQAWLNAPSANSRRNRLGMRNATLKASVNALAPKMEAINNSRPKPSTREARVSRDTTEADLNKLTCAV